jgi:hypothetical protein
VTTKIDTLEVAMKNKGGYTPGVSSFNTEPAMVRSISLFYSRLISVVAFVFYSYYKSRILSPEGQKSLRTTIILISFLLSFHICIIYFIVLAQDSQCRTENNALSFLRVLSPVSPHHIHSFQTIVLNHLHSD